jgi:hypothetical protein
MVNSENILLPKSGVVTAREKQQCILFSNIDKKMEREIGVTTAGNLR